MVRGLQTMSQLLTIAAKEYAKTDEQAAGAVNTTMQQPGGSGGVSGGVDSGSRATSVTTGGAAGDRRVGELAHQMNLAGSASSAAAGQVAPLGQVLPTVVQAVQGAAAQSTQLAGGLAQQAVALAQQIVELAEQADETGDDEPDPAGPAEGQDR